MGAHTACKDLNTFAHIKRLLLLLSKQIKLQLRISQIFSIASRFSFAI